MHSLLKSVNSIASIGLVFSSARMLIGATSALFLLSKGISAGDLGIIKSLQALLILLLDFPLGVLADRKGRRLCLILGCATGAGWLGLTAGGTSFWILMLAEALNAFSLASFNGAFDAVLAEKYIAEKGRPQLNQLLGDYHTLLFALMAFCSLVGGAFVSPSSSFFWWVASCILIFLTALIPFLVKNDSVQHAESPAVGATSSKKSLLVLLKVEMVEVLRQVSVFPELRRIVVPMIGVSVFYQIIIQYWQLFFADLNQKLTLFSRFEVSLFGPLFFGILVIQSIASKAMSFESTSKLSIKHQLFSLAAVTIAFSGVTVSSPHAGASIVGVLLLFGALRLFSLKSSAEIHTLIEDRRRASFLSAVSLVIRMVLLVTLPACGFLIEKVGLWSIPVFGSLVIVSLVGFEIFASKSAPVYPVNRVVEID